MINRNSQTIYLSLAHGHHLGGLLRRESNQKLGQQHRLIVIGAFRFQSGRQFFQFLRDIVGQRGVVELGLDLLLQF